MRIRLASSTDAPAIAAIYAPVVRETTISFETEPPDADEMAERIAKVLPRHPWLVAEVDGQVIGYAYAGAHRSRAAYQWSVEPSVYVAEDARRTGVARRLYTALFAVLRAQGFVRAYAGVTLPNAPSLGLHRALGFEDVGVYRGVGYKHGAWHDVWWGALDLSPARDEPPASPRSVTELIETDELATILSAS
ncbi:MAG: arsinothricin resistance N-acetyltransferase ArsN1 family B [Bacteroidota bacterium]